MRSGRIWGALGMSCNNWPRMTINDYALTLTDFVANGSFASLRENVEYKSTPDYAVLIRLTDFKNGYNGGFVYVSKLAYDFLKKSSLQGGEIIIANVGNVGTVFRAPRLKYKMTLGPNAIMLKTKGYDTFYYYWLSSSEGQETIRSIVAGSAQPKFNKTDFRKINIPVPSIPEQRAIARVLSSLDDKIELNNRMNKTLEEITQTLFKRWFVDFEFPDENGNPYKSSGGKMVDSDLGMIPDGWRVGCIDYLGTIVGGGTPSKARDDYFCDSGIAWITPKDLSNTSNKYIAHGAIDITHDGYKNSSTQLMPSGTVLFSSRAPIGYLAIANNEITTNQGFKSIVPNKGFGSEFVYYMMKLISPDIENQATGSTFKEVSGGELKRFPILLPKTSISTDFSIIADSLGKFRQKSEQQSSLLIQLRDTLLPKLMSGEIRVAISEEKSNEQQT